MEFQGVLRPRNAKRIIEMVFSTSKIFHEVDSSGSSCRKETFLKQGRNSDFARSNASDLFTTKFFLFSFFIC